MTTFAVATPHTLILTVSHGLLFRQAPLLRGGMNAVANSLNLTSKLRAYRAIFSRALFPQRDSRVVVGFRRRVSLIDAANPQQCSP